MNNARPIEPTAGMSLSLGDIYYIVFRHKWKIIILSLMGILVAAGIYHFRPPPYQSQAELLIKYVSESSQVEMADGDQKVILPGSQGQGIINSEIQILTSLDVAEEAATNIGAANILADVGGGSNINRAAGLIRANLEAEPADSLSSIIMVTFKHPNPQIVQPVLQEVISDYFQKHYEIHSLGGQLDDALTMEQSTLNVQLNATEQQIADLKNKANITSIDDSQKDVADQITKIRDEVLDAQVELSGVEAAMKQGGGNQLSQEAVTNVPQVIPPIEVDAYTRINANLEAFRKKEDDYLIQGFTHSNSLVQAVDEQITDAEKTKSDLEKKYPEIGSATVVSTATTDSLADLTTDPKAQNAKIAALQAKIKVWNDQLAQLQTQATNLNNLAPAIAQLDQTEAIEKANYEHLSISLEQHHIDESLDTGKSPNIKWVQTPSPPWRDWKKTHKIMAMAAFGGIFAGLAWAFVFEMFLDRSVKRPVEVKTKLKMPFFLSIPDVRPNGHASAAKTAERRRLQLKNGEETGASAPDNIPPADGNTALQVVSLEQNRVLQPFYEALRDRLIGYFEAKNLTHKPKLVAVTAAHGGAGVSTVAAGLAASLSATGEGNVLLVDMNLENGTAQRFYKGKATCGLDTVLKHETREEAMVHENLYVVNGNSNNGLPQALPKRFSALIPSLKTGDFDYIIFDLPAVSPTSITSRLAKFMDMTLVVLESEKTSLEVVQQANTWLVESGATVGVVLNKTRQYVPTRLNQEFISDR